MTTQKSRPLVAVIGTGGTISTLARDRFDYVEYADGAAKLDLAGGELDAVVAARRRGVLIVVSSRALGGRVLSRESLRRHRIVTADNLSPQKARILLMLGLTVTEDPREIQRMFDEY